MPQDAPMWFVCDDDYYSYRLPAVTFDERAEDGPAVVVYRRGGESEYGRA